MNTPFRQITVALATMLCAVLAYAQVFNPSGPIALVQTVPLTNAIYGRVGVTNMVLIVRGDNVIGDGGGGVFSWLHSDTNTADNLRYFAATNGGNWYKLSYWYDGIGPATFTNLTVEAQTATNLFSVGGKHNFINAGGGNWYILHGEGTIETNEIDSTFYAWVESQSGGGGGTNFFGVNGSIRTDWNIINSAEVAYTVSGVTNFYASIVAGSIATNKIDTTFYSWVESMAGGGGTNYTQFWYDLTNSLVASNNVTFAYDTGAQKLLISAVTAGASGTTVTVDGGSDLSRLNHADGTRISQTLTGTNLVADLIADTITSNYLTSSSVTQDKLSATGTPTSTNFLAGDWVYKQITTNMIPGLNAILSTIGTGGGTSTNILVNGTLVTQADLVDSSNIVWNVSGSSISATITNVAGANTDDVVQRIGYAYFTVTNNSASGDFSFVEVGGIVEQLNCFNCQNDEVGEITISLTNNVSTNYFWTITKEGPYGVNGASVTEKVAERATNNITLIVYDLTGTPIFSDISGYMFRFNLYQLVSVGGSGSGASFSDSAELRALLSDETGTGFAVFSDSPTFSGTVTFADLSIGTINVTTNLTIPTASPGASNSVAASTKYVDDAVAAAGGSSFDFWEDFDDWEILGPWSFNGSSGTTGVEPGGTFTAIASGINAMVATGSGLGVMQIRTVSSAVTSSGGHFNTGTATLALGELATQIKGVFTLDRTNGAIYRLGFSDSVSTTEPVDALGLSITNDTACLVSLSNSVRTVSASTFQLQQGVPYTFFLTQTNDFSALTVYSNIVGGPDVAIWSETVTGIPLGSARALGVNFGGYNSSTANTNGVTVLSFDHAVGRRKKR